jgi:hypothetical protein
MKPFGDVNVTLVTLVTLFLAALIKTEKMFV